MASAKQDWLPQNHEALYNKANRTVNYLTSTEVRIRLGFTADTPQGKWLDGVFSDRYGAFVSAYNVWKNPAQRTPIMAAAFADARKAFTPVYRQLYTGLLKQNPLVAETDLVAMNLPERPAGGRSPVPVPHTTPEAEIVLPSPAVIEVHFRDAGSDHVAKPRGVHGAEIAWAILDAAPVNWGQLTHTRFGTHTPFHLVFEGDQRGKRLYFALRWENTRGKKGPWSNIQDAVIP
jgi:hypothetical protein